MTSFQVVHATRYRYAEAVTASYGEHHLLPRNTPRQRVASAEVTITPTPDEAREHVDLHGNRVGWFSLLAAHEALDVVARSVVEVTAGGPPPSVGPWEVVRDTVAALTDPAGIEARGLVLDSPQIGAIAALRELAGEAFPAGRDAVEGLAALTSLLHAEFEFDPTATTVTTPVEEVLEARAGVCQDFAHLMVGALRSLGLPARYVSGYLETDPPPGTPRLQGADASHAWASMFAPGVGWVDADPTNDQLVGERHVTLAWGRDYGDVAPLKGVIFTDGVTDELVVEVDVLRLDPATGEPEVRPVRPE